MKPLGAPSTQARNRVRGSVESGTPARGPRPVRTRPSRVTARNSGIAGSRSCSSSASGPPTGPRLVDTYAHLWPDSDDSTRAAVDAVLLARSEVTAFQHHQKAQDGPPS